MRLSARIAAAGVTSPNHAWVTLETNNTSVFAQFDLSTASGRSHFSSLITATTGLIFPQLIKDTSDLIGRYVDTEAMEIRPRAAPGPLVVAGRFHPASPAPTNLATHRAA